MEDGLGYLESTEPQVLFENHQGLHQGAMNSAIWVSNGSSPGVAENLVPNDTRQQYAHSCMKPGSVPNPLVIGNSSQATYATNNYSYGPTPVGYNHEPMPCGPCPPVAKDGLVHLTNISDYSKRVVMPNSAEPNNWSMVGTMVRLGREQQAPLRTDAAWVGGDPFVPVVPNTSPVNRVSVVPSDQVHSAFGYHFMDNLHSAPNMVQTSQVLETGNNRIPGFGGNAAGSVLTKCYASNANISHFRVQPVNGAAKSTAQPREGDGLNHHVVSGRLNHQGQPSGSATGSAKLQLALMGGNSLRVMDKPSLKRYLDERLRRAEDVQRVLTEAQKDLKQAPTTTGAIGKKGPHVPRILGGKAKQWRRKKAPKGAELAVDPSVSEGAHGPVPLIEGEAEEIVVEVDLPEGMFSEEDEDTEGHFAVAEEDGGVSVDRDDSNGPHAEPQTSVKDRTADNRGKDRRKRHSTSWHRTWDPKMSILVLKRVKDGVRVSGKGGGRPAEDSHPSKDLPRRTSLLDNGKLRNVSLKDCYVRLVRCDAPGGVLYRGQGDKTEPCTTAEVGPSHGSKMVGSEGDGGCNEGDSEDTALLAALPDFSTVFSMTGSSTATKNDKSEACPGAVAEGDARGESPAVASDVEEEDDAEEDLEEKDKTYRPAGYRGMGRRRRGRGRRTSASRSDMPKSRRKRTGQQGSAALARVKIEEEERPGDWEVFVCDLCGRSFSKRFRLAHHIRAYHPREGGAKGEDGRRVFTCQQCSKTFTGKANLNKHLRIHTGEKPFVCEECGRAFTFSKNLAQHRRVHGMERPFVCEVCGRAFRFSKNLTQHRGVHAHLKPHVCTICGRGFTRSTHLSQHKRLHSGEKPFSLTHGLGSRHAYYNAP
ncbi:uncharacterized protein [Hetaerina americana]|uniref:uncharacterized protein n=1 Tax=Hetaerina americana TaxID=62018 RepID=UPI003A7F2B2F